MSEKDWFENEKIGEVYAPIMFDFQRWLEAPDVAENSFDCVINLYTLFGYCEIKVEDLLILKNIVASVKKDGWFIMECISRERAVRYFIEGEWFERAGKTVLTEFSVRGLGKAYVHVESI